MQQAEVGLQFLNEPNLKTSVGRCLVLMPQETVGGRCTRDMERSPPTGATVMQWCSWWYSGHHQQVQAEI